MKRILSILFAAVFLFAGNAQAAPSTSLEMPAQGQSTVNQGKTADPACQLALAGARCPACCTKCGTKDQDCSDCKPKDSDKKKLI